MVESAYFVENFSVRKILIAINFENNFASCPWFFFQIFVTVHKEHFLLQRNEICIDVFPNLIFNLENRFFFFFEKAIFLHLFFHARLNTIFRNGLAKLLRKYLNNNIFKNCMKMYDWFRQCCRLWMKYSEIKNSFL